MMNDVVSDPLNVKRVKSEHEKSLAECLQKISQWEKFKADYEKLKERLKTFPDKLSHNVMVPCGKQAFIPGSYVQTNNITVLLGDNWFVEVSAKQASEIAKRRVEQCEKMLKDLEKEKKQFEDWLGFISDIAEHNLVEIKEEYDDEKEKVWREQHSERLREHHKKLAEERRSMSSAEKNAASPEVEAQDTKSDEYYFNRLNELEMEEEEGDSSEDSEEDTSVESDVDKDSQGMQNDSINENDSVTTNQNTIDSTKDVKPEYQIKRSVINFQSSTEDSINQNTITNTPRNENNETEVPRDSESIDRVLQSSIITPDASGSREESSSNATILWNGDHDKHSASDKHVRWIDLSEAKSKTIKFTHSKPVPVKNNKKNRRRRNSSNSEPDDESLDDKTPPAINSPSDIYKRFSYSIQNSKPKSILKTMHSSSTESIMSSGEYSDSAANDEANISPQKERNVAYEDKNNQPSQDAEVEKAFTGEVQEFSDVKMASKPARTESRPKSLFKASRQGTRR